MRNALTYDRINQQKEETNKTKQFQPLSHITGLVFPREACKWRHKLNPAWDGGTRATVHSSKPQSTMRQWGWRITALLSRGLFKHPSFVSKPLVFSNYNATEGKRCHRDRKTYYKGLRCILLPVNEENTVIEVQHVTMETV